MISTVSWIEARTFVAVALSIACFAVFVATVVYLRGEWREFGRTMFGFVRNQAALAICVFMLGETITRLWGAALIAAFSRGYDIGQIESAYPFAFIGSSIMFVGAMAKLRIFTPDRWSIWLLLIVASVAVVAGGLAVFV